MPLGVFSQSRSLISPDSVSLAYPSSIEEEQQFEGSEAAIDDDEPIGTITTDIVVAIKVGESSNGYSFILGENTQISAVSSTDGDAIAFIYRQNISNCGGSTVKNGLLRYSISTNGGTIWNVSPSDLSYPGYQPNICYGLGPVNPAYEQVSRYPNFLLTLPPEETTLSGMMGIYQAPVHEKAFPASTIWDGMVTGLVTTLEGPPTVSQEEYVFQKEAQYLPYHLTERVPGEYWSVSWNLKMTGGENVKGNILQLNRGLYHEQSGKIHWQNAHSIPIEYLKFLQQSLVDSSEARGTPSIAFSPDGKTGYIGLNADIGKADSVFSPVFLRTTDGGLSWSEPFEVNLTRFPTLIDSLQSFWTIVDTTTGQLIPAGNGIPTTAFSHDLVVDQHGHPHFFCVIGNSAANLQNGNVGRPFYGLADDLEMVVCDITFDANEQPNVLLISQQSTFRHQFGGISGESWEADPWIQASRSKDGSKVFFSWTDTDTTGNLGWKFNNEPNLITRGLDVNSLQATHLRNWTLDDQNWSGQVYMPKMAPICLDDSVTYRLPVVMMEVQNNSPLSSPVSFWYFNNISYSAGQFSEPLRFVNDCEMAPISLMVSEDLPDCGIANGNLEVQASGGVGQLDIRWKNSDGYFAIPLPHTFESGSYQIEVIDEIGCQTDTLIVLNEPGAPLLQLDSVSGIRCHGEMNGMAFITATADSGRTVAAYQWTNGETSAMATKLAGGVHTVRVVDSEGCSSWLEVEVDEPEPIQVDLFQEPIACHNDENGFLAAFATGGTGVLSFEWSSGEQSASLSDLAPGAYQVRITDGSGCMVQAQQLVINPEKMVLKLSGNDNTSYQAPFNGFAAANFTGGVPPLSFTWTGPDGFTGISNIIFGLNGGQYLVTAEDQNGCIVKDSVVIRGVIWNILGGVDPLRVGVNTFSISPNPTDGTFSLTLEMNHTQDVRVSVLNLNGQQVSHVEKEDIDVLRQQITLENQPSGIYFVQVTTERGTVGRRVVLRK